MEKHESELIGGFGNDWDEVEPIEGEELEESEASIDFEYFKEEFETMLLEHFAKHYQNDLSKVKENIHSIINTPDMNKFQEYCEAYKKKWEQQTAGYKHIDLTLPENEGTKIYLQSLEVHSTQNYSSFVHYLHDSISIQTEILVHFQQDLTEICLTIEKKANEMFPENISVSGKKPENVCYPLDKVTHTLFRNLQKGEYALSAEKSGSDREITTVLTIDFDELKQDTALTFRELTPFDQRIYISAESLLEAGNEYISPSQIYKAMGGKGRPAPNQIENIINSCTGMMATRIKIDNHEEAEAYNYPEYQRGIFYLFPVEIAENVSINGKPTDFCLHFLKKELPLFEYSRCRKQVTQFTSEQWALPFSMTEDNISLDSYFRTRISRMKHDKKHSKTGKYNGKMLYDTIYEKCGIDTRKKRFDATKKFRKLLDHYVKTGIISAYKEESDGFKIIL